MKNFTQQSDEKSSEKEKSNAKTFTLRISTGIFEHYARLRDARWLLDLFVDWTTKEVPTPDGRRDGIVLGGKPIRDEDTASAFDGQCTARTTRRWRLRLARFGYISQKRTPIGYVIRVKKSKKWAHLDASDKKSDRPKMASHSESELPNVADLTARNGHSELPNVADPIKTVQYKTETVAEEDAAAAAYPPSLKSKARKILAEAWENIGIQPVGSMRFCEVWERFYVDAADGQLLSDVMEAAIQYCQVNGIRVPPPFFAAKRLIEKTSMALGSPEETDETYDAAERIGASHGVGPKYQHLVRPTFPTHDVPD